MRGEPPKGEPVTLTPEQVGVILAALGGCPAPHAEEPSRAELEWDAKRGAARRILSGGYCPACKCSHPPGYTCHVRGG